MIIAFIILLISLFCICIQDWKTRQIWWFLPPIVFACGLYLSKEELVFYECLLSFCFVAFLISSLYLYIKFRFHNLNLFKSYFGLGDLLMLLSFIPFFSFQNYVYFFTVTTIFSLVIHLIVHSLRKQETIPYAGYLAIQLSVYVQILYYFNFNFLSLLDV
jgi:hypothetical protein